MSEEKDTTTEEPLDAVLVVKTTDDEGRITTNVLLNGNIQATEVQTLLEFGLKTWRNQLGLDER